MKIAITGANGFIGRYTVDHALKMGHDVVAMVRNSFPQDWETRERLVVCKCDLLEAGDLDQALKDCDALVHLAAVMSGDQQYSDTLELSQKLVKAMDKASVGRLIGLSSISVLDYTGETPMTLIDENIPLNQDDRSMGPYALMKRDQEMLFGRWREQGKSLVVLRPGVVYDKNNLSSAHVGFIKGKSGIAASHRGFVPVVHVDSVVKAIVAAASLEVDDDVFHLTNDQLPTQAQYIKKLQEKGVIGRLIKLPWRFFFFAMTSLRLLLSLTGKVPDSFRRNSLAARQKPFDFSNEKAKKKLGWQPRQAIDD